MALTSRRPRPLGRNEMTFRDDRLFIVATDDTYAPLQYFNEFQLSRVKILVVPTTDGTSSAPHVLARLEKYDTDEDDQRWMLLDTDHYIKPDHAATFVQTIAEARQKGMEVALSRPCFDFWLLLHHVDDLQRLNAIGNARDVLQELRRELGEFNKTNLDMSKFPLPSVVRACRIAKILDKAVKGGDRPESPMSDVYKLWTEIISSAQRSQLPDGFTEILTAE